jgi:limonene-1,2-epoxide hydrolase
MPEVKQIDATIFGVGVNAKGQSVVWAMIDGSKWEIPTSHVTMAQLAARGLRVINER